MWLLHFFLYLSCTVAMNVIFQLLRWDGKKTMKESRFLPLWCCHKLDFFGNGEVFVLNEHHLISAAQPDCTSFSSCSYNKLCISWIVESAWDSCPAWYNHLLFPLPKHTLSTSGSGAYSFSGQANNILRIFFFPGCSVISQRGWAVSVFPVLELLICIKPLTTWCFLDLSQI